MEDVKRDTITISTIITILFMLRKKKAEAAETEKAQELVTGPISTEVDGGEVISPGQPFTGEEIDFSQQKAIFIRYPGYKVFVAPVNVAIQKEDDTITLKQY